MVKRVDMTLKSLLEIFESAGLENGYGILDDLSPSRIDLVSLLSNPTRSTMRTNLVALATHRASRFADKPPLPLDYFINRANALSLYRQFIRSTKSLGDRTSRWETVQWIRQDFERYRTVTESEKSKTLLALGQRQLKQLNATGSLLGGESSKFRGTRTPGHPS